MAERQRKILTLCIVHRHPLVLLGMKKRGFGAGRWNGFGGKVLAGEGIAEAARREFREEAGIVIEEMERVGILEFAVLGQSETHEVHVFRAERFSGQPRETEEMRPSWFSVDRIPFDEMWPDDRHWFPLLLAHRKFRGKFLFDESEQIVDWSLAAADQLA